MALTGFKPKVTAKGTELPLVNLKGKPYLQVAHRLVWFREDHPDGIIKTQIMENSDGTALVRAEIYITGENGQPQLTATAHKVETKTSFGDYIEKAETGAVGRALAMCGYGTQFEPEFDEGNRLADAPVTTVTSVIAEPPVAEAPNTTATNLLTANETATEGASVKKMSTFRKTAKATGSDDLL